MSNFKTEPIEDFQTIRKCSVCLGIGTSVLGHFPNTATLWRFKLNQRAEVDKSSKTPVCEEHKN